MIGSIDNLKASLARPMDFSQGAGAEQNPFNAALEVARKEEAREITRKSELEDIRNKGFRAWAGAMQVEQLKKKLREKIMKAMGLSEEDLAKMAPAIQQILEQKIQQEIEQQLEAEMRQQQAEKSGEAQGRGTQNAQDSASMSGMASRKTSAIGPETGPSQAEPQSKNGKKCPVIPALAWPGAPPLTIF